MLFGSSAVCVLLAACAPTPAPAQSPTPMNGYYQDSPTAHPSYKRKVTTPAEAAQAPREVTPPEDNKSSLKSIQKKLDDTETDLNDTIAKLRTHRPQR